MGFSDRGTSAVGKFLLIVAVSLALLALAAAEVPSYGDDIEAVAKEGPVFVKFYAPWCGHCKRLAPTWEKLGDKVEAEAAGTVKIAKVDCTAEGKTACSKFGIKGFPTLKLLYPDSTTDSGIGEVPYKSQRNLEELFDFANKAAANPKGFAAAESAPKTESKEKPAKDSDVLTLTDANFKSTISGSADVVFVKFYAPWCGHCKKLAPTWENLGKEFKGDSSVSIGKVDCTQHKSVCQEQGVRGYPTLKAWVKGAAEGEKYQGGRELQALKTWVEGKK